MKQITIDDLIPFLKKGWVAMDENGTWSWFSSKPEPYMLDDEWVGGCCCILKDCFNIKLYQGDWKDSLRRVK